MEEYAYDLSNPSKSMHTLKPTPYPEVNSILAILLNEVLRILAGKFLGLYLHGSLAYGGFDRSSDVDFVVVTRTRLNESTFQKLKTMHKEIARLESWVATQLEGIYVPKYALQQYDPVNALHIHIDRGEGEELNRMQINDPLLSRGWWSGWVLLRHVLLEFGVTLAGPAPSTFINPVSKDEIIQSMIANLEGWAEPLLAKPELMQKPGYQSYVVLTMCRTLFSFENGSVVSKQAAVCWALEKVDKSWAPLIERAWNCRHQAVYSPSFKDQEETLAFIQFTLAFCKPALA